MVIDCHVHLNNYHHDPNLPVPAHLDRLRQQMAKYQLEHAIILTSYKIDHERPSVQHLLEAIQQDPKIHVVEGIGITTGAPPDWDHMEERLRKGLVRGIKLYPGYEHLYPGDRAFRPAIELAGRYRVPIMIHSGDTYHVRGKIKYSHPIHIDEVCVDHPDVNFVICHMGNPWMRTAAEIIYKNHNAYADISGLTLEAFDSRMEEFMRDELAKVLLYSGEPDKILFGTDWPLVRMGPYLRFVESLELEPDHRELLLRENAARLFRLPLGRELRAPIHMHSATAGPERPWDVPRKVSEEA